MALTPKRPPEAPKGPPERAGEKPKAKTPEELAALQEEIDESGEAKEYIETFRKGRNFELLATHLELGMQYGDTQGFSNFENWLTQDPEGMAEFFDAFPFVPRGKGRGEFVNGLRDSPDTEDFKKSRTVLEELVKILRTHFDEKRNAKVDVQTQITKHPMGDTIGNGVKTLMKNFNRAQGTEKLMILAAVGIGIVLINKYKDSKVPWTKDTKWSTVFLGLGALWGVNYLSGKVSQDGRTLLQRLDVMRDIDDMSENSKLRGYAEKLGMGEDQERLKTFHQLIYKGVSAKKLFDLYEEAALSTVAVKEIDPKNLGFYKNEVSGKALYDLMDTLVKQTSVNEHNRLKLEEAEVRRVPFTPAREGSDEEKAWQQPGVAIAAFREKYVTGELGNVDMTYFDAVMNEYNVADTAWREDIRRGKEARLTDRAAKKGKEALKWTYAHGKHYGIVAGKWVYAKGKATYEFTRDHFAKPLGAMAQARFNRYSPYVEKPINNLLAKRQQEDLDEVLGPEFDVKVTTPETNMFHPEMEDLGSATIMDYPGIRFEVKVRKDGKEVAIIDGLEFLLDDGIDGNKDNAKELKKKITAKAEKLIQSRNIPVLKGIKPAWTWNETKKEWVLYDVKFNADSLLSSLVPGGEKEISFKIGPDAKSVKFFVNGMEITDFDKLDTIYRDSVIQEKIWTDRRFGKSLEGLPVTIENVTPDTTYKAIITGKIAGLEFQAVPNASGGIDFFDGSRTGGANLLVIDEAKGGLEFTQRKAAHIMASGEFQNPFFHLESLMDNTSEGVFARMKQMFPTTRLWIIPTSLNIPAGVNGQILQQQWRYLLDFKRMETLDRFRYELLGKSVADIPKIYKKYIQENLKYAQDLAHDISATGGDEEKANKFQDFMARLETMNYTNPDYRKLFLEYKKMMIDSQFNYEGTESFGDVGVGKWSVADRAFEIYQILLTVWNYHTDEFSVEDPMAAQPAKEIHPHNQKAIRAGVIEKVRAKLEQAQTRGGGTIKLDDVKDDIPLDAWVDHSWAPKGRRLKSIP